MRPTYVTQASTGASDPIALDLHKNPFNVTISIVIAAGATSDVDVQWTADNVQAPGYDPSTGNWYDLSGLNNVTVSEAGVLDFPATALRMVVQATDQPVVLQVLQAG